MARLNAEIAKILQLPDVRERILSLGLEIVGGTPEEFNLHLASETRKWSEVIRVGNIKAD